SAHAGSFVEVLNSNTVLVSADNQTKRRDYEAMVLKTFYLPNGASPQRLTETITTLRATLYMRYLAQSTVSNALVVRDTPTRVATAEKIIGAAMPLVAGASVATRGEIIGNSPVLTLENGTVKDSAPAWSTLSVSSPGPVSLNVKDNTRPLFERLGRMAGVNVIFDADFRNLDGFSFKVDNIDVLDAIELLALQLRAFWEPVDSKTILVSADNQAKRRDFGNLSVKTFYLTNVSKVEMIEIVTALRTILNARYLATVSALNAIVMRGT